MVSTDRRHRIVILPGDHIGKEVTAEAERILRTVLDLRQRHYSLSVELVHGRIGGHALDVDGHPFPETTRQLIQCPDTRAVFLGAVGGPEWPPHADTKRPEQGILELRQFLDVWMNVRPCTFPSQSLVDGCSPLKKDRIANVHFTVLRELCGGIYFGEKREAGSDPVSWGPDTVASDVMIYSVGEVERITRAAGHMARSMAQEQGWPRGRVTSVDKSNVLASSRLWRAAVTRVMQTEFPDVELNHGYVDSIAMLMIQRPEALNGIVLTGNMFGDILSDEASVLVGSLGLLPSASLSGYPACGKPGLYEPIHGSAPDISGQNIANPVGAILSVAMLLRHSLGMAQEAAVVEAAVRQTLDVHELGGFEYRTRDLGGSVTTRQFGEKVTELVREKLGSLHGVEFMARMPAPPSFPSTSSLQLDESAKKLRPMNLCEKIIAHHAVPSATPVPVSAGQIVCVKVDWTLASELTWKGMEKTYDEIGRPGIWRNDRFWLAIDHTVDPSINHLPKPKGLISASESFAKEVQIKDFHGPNNTILHTDFYRKRVQPGMLIVGADSHSCSAGGLGAFAVGLGAADVLLPLVTGETWFKVPEVCNIRLVGRPSFGIGGKDVILWILGRLKRNTVAFERAVEFTGPGCQYLSCDARFAIANMATEFGAIAGVFEADHITQAYIQARPDAADKSAALYFRTDPNAAYAEIRELDLSDVQSLVALYPSPDNVVQVAEVEGMRLDGVFIGACTTGEEDLILAALVLEQGMANGFVPCIGGKRKVTPGSVSILSKLRRLGLVDVYEQAGFEIGAPGCSYCLGIAADKAGEGEVWLSSQNRNFKNRMGKGSYGYLASAATVAISSFDMMIRDPKELLNKVDVEKFQRMCDVWGIIPRDDSVQTEVNLLISEPCPEPLSRRGSLFLNFQPPEPITGFIQGFVQKFGDHVDTDAIIPAEFMPGTSDAELGTHCFQFVRPEFREKARQEYTIVVAGKLKVNIFFFHEYCSGAGFGSGSSREEAPRSLKGCGIQAVIARSFAFIYGRNQSNMALLGTAVANKALMQRKGKRLISVLGIVPDDFDAFYELVNEGSKVVINVAKRLVGVVQEDLNANLTSSSTQWFNFQMSRMEERLISGGGLTNMYRKYGSSLFRVAMSDAPAPFESAVSATLEDAENAELNQRRTDLKRAIRFESNSGCPSDRDCADEIRNW